MTYSGKKRRRNFRYRSTKRRRTKNRRVRFRRKVKSKPVSKLGRTKRVSAIVKEQAISASNSATVTYGIELFNQAAAYSANEANKRFTSKVWAKGFHIRGAFVNSASQEMFVRIAVVSAKAGIAASVFTTNNPELMGVHSATATEAKEDYPLSEQNTQNLHSLLLRFDFESISKIHWQRTFKLGPAGGSGARSAIAQFQKYVPINRWQKHEKMDGTAITNGRIFLIAYAVDPTNDTASTLSVEMTYVADAVWQDCVN